MENQLRIIVATRNPGKLEEIQSILKDLPLEFGSLEQYPTIRKPKESALTYLENASEKAKLAAEHAQLCALADDSGLEVEGLNWEPGVRSSRYAGEDAADAENIQKLLEELKDVPHEKRKAVFRCTMVFHHPDGREIFTVGECWGEIADEPKGEGGFGYDPVFYLPHLGKTFAQLTPEEKNRISHRTKALEKLKEYLHHLVDNPPPAA